MLRKHNSRRKQQELSNLTGVVDPLPTAAELYGSDDALPHNLGLKGAAAKAAAAAAFPTPLYICQMKCQPLKKKGVRCRLLELATKMEFSVSHVRISHKINFLMTS